MRAYILKSLLFIFIFNENVLAKDVVDGLIKSNKITETEFITHYNEDQAISTALSLIKKHQGTRLEPELRHRLADLYIRKSKTRNFLDQLLKKKGKNFSSEFESVPQIQKILKNAILELQTIEKNYPKYGKMDEVFYTMGMSYLKLGQIDLAERPFLLLTKKHKNSPLFQDSNLSLAEIYYSQKNYKTAEIYFSKLASDSTHNAQSYSIYKRAWTRFYQNEHMSAFKDMKEAYVLSVKKKNGFDISTEVLTDIPLFTAEVFKGDQVFQQLSSFIKDSKKLNMSLDDHAKVFAERSDYLDESAVLSVLLKRSSASSQKFEYLSRLSMSNEKMDKLDLTADFYEKAHKLLNKKIEDSTKEEFLVFGRNLVKNTYKEWIKADDKAKKRISLKPVLKIGDLAQSTMENSDEQKPKFINILAELNFDLGSFVKAGEYYEQASDVSNNKAESHELLYSAIVSTEKSVVGDKWIKATVLRQRHLVQKYDQKYPAGNYGLEVLYKFARVEEKFGKQDLALETFRRLGSQYPDTIKGKDSQDFVIKIYEKNKDYASVNKYLEEVLPKAKDISRLSILKPIYDNSFFLMAETNEKKGRYRAAIMNYKDYLKSSYLRLKMPEASWNIAVNYKKAGLKTDAADAFLSYYKSNKNSSNSKLALEESLALYEKVTSYSKVEDVAWILEGISAGSEKLKWTFALARVNIENKKFKDAEQRFSKLVFVSDAKINTDVHQYLFDHVEKIKVGFKENALRVLQNGQEPFRSEALILVAKELMDEKKNEAARSKLVSVLKSPKALAESKGKAAILIAEMEVKNLSLAKSTKPMNFNATLQFIEQTMAKAKPITADFQNVLTYGHDESSLRALIKLSRLYLDLGIVMSSLIINDKPDLKLAIEREIRNLKSTLRSSFYESYEGSLNVMAKNSKLKSKYNSRIKRIRQEFETFYSQNSIASRGES